MSFLAWLAGNALFASGLAVLVALASRLGARPGLVRGLWIVVLLRLVAPPVGVLSVPVSKLWTPDNAVETEPTAPPVVEPEPTTLVLRAAPLEQRPGLTPRQPLHAAVTPDPTLASTRDRPSTPAALPWWSTALALAVLAGAGLVLTRGLLRMRRLRRVVGCARGAGPGLRISLTRVAERLGVRKRFELKTVLNRLSPFLTVRRGRPTIVFPDGLERDLDEDQRRLILAHEVAHYRLRDHWVRGLELLCTALFWWCPTLWWARRRLHAVQELCCDEQVLRYYRDREREYARTLLAVSDFVSRGSAPAIGLAATGSPSTLFRRLEMILSNKRSGGSSVPLRLAAGVFAVSALTLDAGFAREDDEKRIVIATRGDSDDKAKVKTKVRTLVVDDEGRVIADRPVKGLRARRSGGEGESATITVVGSRDDEGNITLRRMKGGADDVRVIELDGANMQRDELDRLKARISARLEGLDSGDGAGKVRRRVIRLDGSKSGGDLHEHIEAHVDAHAHEHAHDHGDAEHDVIVLDQDGKKLHRHVIRLDGSALGGDLAKEIEARIHAHHAGDADEARSKEVFVVDDGKGNVERRVIRLDGKTAVPGRHRIQVEVKTDGGESDETEAPHGIFVIDGKSGLPHGHHVFEIDGTTIDLDGSTMDLGGRIHAHLDLLGGHSAHGDADECEEEATAAQGVFEFTDDGSVGRVLRVDGSPLDSGTFVIESQGGSRVLRRAGNVEVDVLVEDEGGARAESRARDDEIDARIEALEAELKALKKAKKKAQKRRRSLNL